MTTKQQDFIVAVLFIVTALLMLLVAIPFGVVEPKKVKFDALNPSYYPRIVSYCLLVFGVVLLIVRIAAKSATDTTQSSKKDSGDINLKRLLWIAGILAFYYLSLPTLGFVLSSMIVLLLLLLIAGESSPWTLICLPIVLPFGLYYFFVKVANIPIPAGILESVLVGS